VTAKTVIGALLMLLAMTAHAQGVISSVAKPTESSALPPPLPVPPANGTLNPFLPHAPALPVPPPPVVGTPRTEVDPVQAALQARQRDIREHGVRLGKIDGQVIYRHEGQYLIEPDTGRVTTGGITGAAGSKRFSGPCVIHIVHLPAEKPSDSTQASHVTRDNESAMSTDSKTNL
jgi:hypothetical protein